jgi:hypothetical protein
MVDDRRDRVRAAFLRLRARDPDLTRFLAIETGRAMLGGDDFAAAAARAIRALRADPALLARLEAGVEAAQQEEA